MSKTFCRVLHSAQRDRFGIRSQLLTEDVSLTTKTNSDVVEIGSFYVTLFDQTWRQKTSWLDAPSIA